jgi:hypothetical protein
MILILKNTLMKGEAELAFKQTIEKYLPKVINLVNSKNKTILDKISSYLERINNLSTDYIIDKPHCVFDWIVMAENGDKQSLSYLKFIDNECNELQNSVDTKLKDKTLGTILSMLLTMDINSNTPNNPAYQSFVAEVVALNQLIKQSEETYELIDIEGPLSNGKTADFVFLNIATKEKIYIDAVSFNGIDKSKIESDDLLIKLIDDKINCKVACKTKTLVVNENQIVVNGEQVTFVILPFIWIEHTDLSPYRSVFEYLDKYSNKTLQCCSIFPQELEDGSYHYQISTINNILVEWELYNKNENM